MKIAFAIVVAWILLAGCATMSPEECAVADWQQLGERDGRTGKSPDYFARRAQDCAEAGFEAERDAWQHGWDRGIADYCTPRRGFHEGREGSGYQHICPGELEPAFLDGYETGLAIHQAEDAIEDTEGKIERTRKRLAELRESERPDRKALGQARQRLEELEQDLREEELRLERARGVAEGRGFPIQ